MWPAYKLLVVHFFILFLCPEGLRSETLSNAEFEKARAELIERHVRPMVSNSAVIAAIQKIPRELFVPDTFRSYAYADHPLPIGMDQTISQPSLVAYMTEALELSGNEKVLEIGTGSGYQAALLGLLAREVFSVEIIPELGMRAKDLLKKLNYKNVHVRIGDGYKGWPEQAPFEAIMVTAAAPYVPQPLIDQLAEGGRMLIPQGEASQELILWRKKKGTLLKKVLLPVRFVALTGKAQKKR